MAGHRKWSNVKPIKSVLDQKRGKFFSRIANENTVATIIDGSEQDANLRLRTTINAGLIESLPDAPIDRLNMRISEELQELVCAENNAPGEMAIREDAAEHKSRTIADLRLIFSNIYDIIVSGGKARNQTIRPRQITVLTTAANDEWLSEADAKDVNTGKNYHVFHMAHDQLYSVGELLVRVGIEPDAQTLTYLPDTTVDLAGTIPLPK